MNKPVDIPKSPILIKLHVSGRRSCSILQPLSKGLESPPHYKSRFVAALGFRRSSAGLMCHNEPTSGASQSSKPKINPASIFPRRLVFAARPQETQPNTTMQPPKLQCQTEDLHPPAARERTLHHARFYRYPLRQGSPSQQLPSRVRAIPQDSQRLPA